MKCSSPEPRPFCPIQSPCYLLILFYTIPEDIKDFHREKIAEREKIGGKKGC
jgi:hypothetical protein